MFSVREALAHLVTTQPGDREIRLPVRQRAVGIIFGAFGRGQCRFPLRRFLRVLGVLGMPATVVGLLLPGRPLRRLRRFGGVLAPRGSEYRRRRTEIAEAG